ncbi:MAG: hypothetical protein NZZ41_07630, partial [Candidatus Dojkabacteria bacterium]|nr:hypothetical protein [Candidatus Dojkabacteria bacterium]
MNFGNYRGCITFKRNAAFSKKLADLIHLIKSENRKKDDSKAFPYSTIFLSDLESLAPTIYPFLNYSDHEFGAESIIKYQEIVSTFLSRNKNEVLGYKTNQEKDFQFFINYKNYFFAGKHLSRVSLSYTIFNYMLNNFIFSDYIKNRNSIFLKISLPEYQYKIKRYLYNKFIKNELTKSDFIDIYDYKNSRIIFKTINLSESFLLFDSWFSFCIEKSSV